MSRLKKSTKSGSNYYIGIDCGASNTEVLVLEESPDRPMENNSTDYKSYKFNAINYNVHGMGESIKRLESIIKKVIGNLDENKIKYIAAGIAGARKVTDRDKIRKTICSHLKLKNISVLADTEIAFASVFDQDERNCGILIAGTGSILYFKNSKGEIIRIGGWGRHLGDEGSGYWIAKEALNLITKHYDGRIYRSALTSAIESKFHLNRENLIKKVYHGNFEISKITETVFKCAESGDFDSNNIIRDAAEHLAKHFIPLRDITARIALMGSLFSEEKLLESYLRELVSYCFAQIELIKPLHKPVWGAVEIAKRLC